MTTDYAIRIICYLATCGYGIPVPGGDIAEATGVSPGYIVRILRMLQNGGMIQSARGSQGGFYLTKGPESIAVYDVMKIMEETVCINRCLEPDGFCSRDGVPICKVHQYFKGLQARVETELNNTLIADLI